MKNDRSEKRTKWMDRAFFEHFITTSVIFFLSQYCWYFSFIRGNSSHNNANNIMMKTTIVCAGMKQCTSQTNDTHSIFFFFFKPHTINLFFFSNHTPLTIIWPSAFAFIAKSNRLKSFWLSYEVNSFITLKGRKGRSSCIEGSTRRSSGGSREGSRSTWQTGRKKTVVSSCVMCTVWFFHCVYYFQPALVSRHETRGGLKDDGGEQTHRSSALSLTHKALSVSSLSMTNGEDFHDQQEGPTLEM